MGHTLKYLLPLLFLLCLKSSLAQFTTDTLNPDSNYVHYFLGDIDSAYIVETYAIDTGLLNFQEYDPLRETGIFYPSLSNIGQAHYSLLFEPIRQMGFYTGIPSFEKYLIQNHEVKYYVLNRPYTSLFYQMSAKREQVFQLEFARELVKGLIVGIDFSLISAPGRNGSGLYPRSKTDNNSVYLTAQYTTNNKRYGLLGNYLHNKLRLMENGGILDDSLFFSNTESDRLRFEVNLSNADNLVKSSGFFINQYFNISRPKNDSSERSWFHLGRITHAFQYKRNQLVYTDQDSISPFYPYDVSKNLPFDSAGTYDSTHQLHYRNTLRWSNLSYDQKPEDKKIYFYFGVHFDMDEISDSLQQESFTNLIPHAGLGMQAFRSSYLNAKGEMVWSGYNSGDYMLNINLTQYIGTIENNFGRLNSSLRIQSQTPIWFYRSYRSNYFVWNNAFQKERSFELKASYQYKNWELSGRLVFIDRMIYMNRLSQPEQFAGTAKLLQFSLKHQLMLGKWGFYGVYVYQEPGSEDLIRVPAFAASLDLFFHTPVFKNAAFLQPGLRFFYNTSYYGYQYMPALRWFYLQDEQEVGNYLYADVYLMLQVKTARIFVKYTNLGAWFMEPRYMMVPNYPMRDPAIHLGISWRFHN